MIFVGSDHVIEGIMEEYVENLQFMWERRCAGLKSADITVRSFADLEERIAAHTDGLVLVDRDAVPWLQEGLAGDDASLSLASAYALLKMEDDEAANLVVRAFQKAAGPCLEGLCKALSYGPIDNISTEIKKISGTGPALQASAAAEVLAFHRNDFGIAKIYEFLKSDDVVVRKTAWRIIALLDGIPGAARAGDLLSFKACAPGLEDQGPGVRQQVIETAIWTRQPWLLDYCRDLASNPSPDRLATIQFLSILGEPTDLDCILTAGKAASLGLSRFNVLASFGHPAVVEVLLDGVGNEDPATAIAAASAYRKITGADIDSEERIKLPPVDGVELDEFEVEFIEEATRPDPGKAIAHWSNAREIFSRGFRWCCGIEVNQPDMLHLPDQLDNQARWEMTLRARFRGLWDGNLADTEKFPLSDSGQN